MQFGQDSCFAGSSKHWTRNSYVDGGCSRVCMHADMKQIQQNMKSHLSMQADKPSSPTQAGKEPRLIYALHAHGFLQDKTVVVITSGANMNFDRLRLVSELADIGALREAMLATSIPESPGSFRAFIDTALSDTSQSVTEFKYR